MMPVEGGDWERRCNRVASKGLLRPGLDCWGPKAEDLVVDTGVEPGQYHQAGPAQAACIGV